MDTKFLNRIEKFKFTKKPTNIPLELRPLRSITLVLLILKINSRRRSASLLKIQFFLWALKSPKNQFLFIDFINNGRDIKQNYPITYDPITNRTILYALADNVVSMPNENTVKLSEKGEKFLELIFKENMFEKDISYLKTFKTTISEVKIKNLIYGDA